METESLVVQVTDISFSLYLLTNAVIKWEILLEWLIQEIKNPNIWLVTLLTLIAAAIQWVYQVFSLVATLGGMLLVTSVLFLH